HAGPRQTRLIVLPFSTCGTFIHGFNPLLRRVWRRKHPRPAAPAQSSWLKQVGQVTLNRERPLRAPGDIPEPVGSSAPLNLHAYRTGTLRPNLNREENIMPFLETGSTNRIETVTAAHLEKVLPLIADYQRFYRTEPDEERNRVHFSQFLEDH